MNAITRYENAMEEIETANDWVSQIKDPNQLMVSGLRISFSERHVPTGEAQYYIPHDFLEEIEEVLKLELPDIFEKALKNMKHKSDQMKKDVLKEYRKFIKNNKADMAGELVE